MNRINFRLALLLALVTSACATTKTRTTAIDARAPNTIINFDDSKAGTVPERWSIQETGKPTASATWMVVRDSTAPSQPNVLALTQAEGHGSTFNIAIADLSSYKDLDLSVMVKAATGEEDQGGGPIWRCKDKNNYYVCRFNPLEGNYRVYEVVNGRRKQLGTARVETNAGEWYSVRVTMVEDQITCYLDGKKLLNVSCNTFMDAGMIGLWTKADAATHFDDLVVRSLTPLFLQKPTPSR